MCTAQAPPLRCLSRTHLDSRNQPDRLHTPTTSPTLGRIHRMNTHSPSAVMGKNSQRRRLLAQHDTLEGWCSA